MQRQHFEGKNNEIKERFRELKDNSPTPRSWAVFATSEIVKK
jgi:hypothetical protein